MEERKNFWSISRYDTQVILTDVFLVPYNICIRMKFLFSIFLKNLNNNF